MAEANNGKLLKLYSLDITENSTDFLRLSLGNYYKTKGTDGYYVYGFAEEFSCTETALPDRPFDVPEDGEKDLRGLEVIRADVASSHNAISKIQINTSRITSINPTSYIPNFKIPVRLYANPEVATGDKFWETYFMGGKFGDKHFPKLIDDTSIFYDTEINFYSPYSYRESEELSIFESANNMYKIQVNYNDYDQYVQKYQDWSRTKHELQLPNFNFSVTGFINGTAVPETPAAKVMYDLQTYYYPSGPPVAYEKNRWCGDAWINFRNSNEDLEQKQNIMQYQQNIMFDQYYYKFFRMYGTEDHTDPHAVYDPDIYSKYENALEDFGGILDHSANMFNVRIDFDSQTGATFGLSDPVPFSYASPALTTDTSGGGEVGEPSLYQFKIRDIIEKNDFSSKFLEILKDLDEGTIQRIPFKRKRYALNQHELKSNPELAGPDGRTDLKTSISYKDCKTFDWIQFLINTYNEYDGAINSNYVFMGPTRHDHATTYADPTAYRFYDSKNLLQVLEKTLDLTQEYFEGLTDISADYEELHLHPTIVGGEVVGPGPRTNVFTPTFQQEAAKTIFNSILSPMQKRSEILAYKIEKVGGQATGDSNTQNIIQKFWMFNSQNSSDKMSLIDSQVKYGESYTYKGYAYVAVLSHKYKYSDFRLTKQIGVYDLNGDGNLDRYCVEFYDPKTMERAEQIFTHIDPNDSEREFITAGEEGTLYATDASLAAQSALSMINNAATNGQDITEFPQLADFHLNLEPCIKIIEVPIFEKTVTVQDNPPNNISVVPFHFLDNSNKLGFHMFAEGFKPAPYPVTITDDDIVKRQNYLRTSDLAITDNIARFSESPARFIEIFRTTTKPTSFESFDGKLVSRIDLRIPNEEFNRKDFVAADKISPGVKYYYVFRFVNENGMPGSLSVLLEAELHDDGGYIYSLFDTMSTSDFKVDPFTTNTTQFKKIFQLEPNMRHLVLDASSANFSQRAQDQVNNVYVGGDTPSLDKLWDKKFKIRLTSKKTGKKLDINLTYNIRVKDMSPVTSRDFESYPDSEDGATSDYDEALGGGSGDTGPIMPPTMPTAPPAPDLGGGTGGMGYDPTLDDSGGWTNSDVGGAPRAGPPGSPRFGGGTADDDDGATGDDDDGATGAGSGGGRRGPQ